MISSGERNSCRTVLKRGLLLYLLNTSLSWRGKGYKGFLKGKELFWIQALEGTSPVDYFFLWILLSQAGHVKPCSKKARPLANPKYSFSIYSEQVLRRNDEKSSETWVWNSLQTA